jgi:hypothetical protein
MPEPTITPMRSAFCSVTSRPNPAGLDTCGHAEMDKRIHVAAFLAGQVILDDEVLHFARETGRKWRGVEPGDVGDARFARQGAFPRFGNGVTDRGNATQASYDDTTVA